MFERRRYVLTKVEPGEYLFPSNDGLTIWRVRNEDGTDEVGWPSADAGWAVYRWCGRAHDYDAIGESIAEHDWNLWDSYAYGLATRREAIDVALRAGCAA